MRREIEAVVDELKRLRDEGVESVYLDEGTLDGLRGAIDPLVKEAKRVSPPAAPPTRYPTPGDPGTAPGAVREDPGPAIPRIEIPAAGLRPNPPPGQDATAAGAGDRSGGGGATPPGATPVPDPPEVELPEGDKETRWEWLRDRVLNCPVCNAHVKPGKKVVFGVGDIDADVFFCGEAPGAEEEVQGEPFVGPAGQLLTKIIKAMGLGREEVYIGNIMNWRPEMPTPTGNRPPTVEEMRFCLPYLRAQIAVVQPKVVVALGNTAVTGLLGPDPNRRMGSVRGRWFVFEGTPMMITYHPSYLLRREVMRNKRTVWEDMLMVMEKVGMEITEKQRGYFLGG